MARSTEFPSLFQFSLPFAEQPKRLVDNHVGEAGKLLAILETQKLWEQKPKGPLAFVNWNTQNGHVYDSTTHREQYPFLGYSPLTRDRFSAVLIATSPLAQTTFESTQLHIQEAVNKLKKGGSFFVFEQKGIDRAPGWRLDILAKTDLVKRDILTADASYLIWRARLPVSIHRQPMDYLARLANAPESWKKGQIPSLIAQITKGYAANGYELVNLDEVLEKLRKTTNIPQDMQSLRLGFGADVASPCGCQWHIDLKGTPQRTLHCPDSDCGGQAPKPRTSPVEPNGKHAPHQYAVGQTVERPDKSCSCGNHLLETVRLVTRTKGGESKLLVELHCAHHGLQGHAHTVYVRDNQLLEI